MYSSTLILFSCFGLYWFSCNPDWLELIMQWVLSDCWSCCLYFLTGKITDVSHYASCMWWWWGGANPEPPCILGKHSIISRQPLPSANLCLSHFLSFPSFLPHPPCGNLVQNLAVSSEEASLRKLLQPTKEASASPRYCSCLSNVGRQMGPRKGWPFFPSATEQPPWGST